MRFSRPSPLTLVTVALIVLLPTLAVLQYRWVGRLSEADRDRMQTHVRNAAQQFRDSVDGEIARAVLNLQVSAATARDGTSDRYSDRFDAWLATAAHPQIVANLFLIDVDGGALRFRRWNQTDHLFEEAEWVAALQPWREALTTTLKNARPGEVPNLRELVPPLDDSFVIAPLRLGFGPPGARPVRPGVTAPLNIEQAFGFTVIQLDLRYIATQMLPELTQRYFMVSEGDRYRVTVKSTAGGGVVFQSDADMPVDEARADVTEPLFGIRGDVFFFNRPGAGRGDRRTVAINILRGRGEVIDNGPPGAGGRARQVDRDDVGRWLLLAQHAQGSLGAAVAETRIRNLAISFGVLLLLSVSVAVLGLSSRRAERLALQQMEFVAGVSHELRTPIAVIRSAAENLAHGVVGNPDRVKRYGEAIGAEARRLGEMVEHVMQYAGLAAGRGISALAPVAPDEIVHQAIGEAAPAAAAAGVTIERRIGDDLPAVLGDAIALRSAVQNLIANAVKYGGADRWVGVRVESTSENRGRIVRVSVADHGRGIAAHELPHIFEPFYRGADALARQVHGNGLGLSIVKRIVVAHGGRVTVVSREGEGSTFTIELPAADPALVADGLQAIDGVAPAATPQSSS